MAVVKEYRCFAHGPFDSTDGICPHGCTTVVREFRTAPAARSDKTKASDRALENLAKKFNLTDMSNRNGSVGGSRKGQQPNMQAQWLDMPKNKDREDKTDVIGPMLASLKVKTDKVGNEPSFADVARGLPKPRPNVVASSGSVADLAAAVERS